MKRKTAVITVSYLCVLALGLGGFGVKEGRIDDFRVKVGK